MIALVFGVMAASTRSGSMHHVSGVTSTVATGGATTTVVESQIPGQVAATIHVEPGVFCAVTRPLASIVAMLGSRET